MAAAEVDVAGVAAVVAFVEVAEVDVVGVAVVDAAGAAVVGAIAGVVFAEVVVAEVAAVGVDAEMVHLVGILEACRPDREKRSRLEPRTRRPERKIVRFTSLLLTSREFQTTYAGFCVRNARRLAAFGVFFAVYSRSRVALSRP